MRQHCVSAIRSTQLDASLWFFSVVTGPLTRPVRAVLPRGTPEPRVRAVALAMYVALWLVSGRLLSLLAGRAAG